MWIEVFHRTRALINIAFHRYMFPTSSRVQLNTSDAEIIVLFEKVVEGNFELATNELLQKAFSVLRSLYSQFQHREISLNSTKETKLLLEAVNGKKSPDFDCDKFNKFLNDENFKQGFSGLEAELYVLTVEIEKFHEAPLLYDRLYRKSRRFYFEFVRDKLDPDGKVMRALLSALDEIDLNRENIVCISHIHTHPANNGYLTDVCLHIILSCNDVEMIEDFVATKKRGRRPNDSLYEHIKNELNMWSKCGMIKKVPTKNSLYKVLQKLRTSPYVKAHLRRLKNST